MSDNIIDLLTACLWDLRSQCESQVRALSAAQRIVQNFGRADDRPSRQGAIRNLRMHVQDLVAANAAIQSVLIDVSRQLDDLLGQDAIAGIHQSHKAKPPRPRRG